MSAGEILVQNVVKLATWDAPISEDPALPTIIMPFYKVMGMDEIRILVTKNEGDQVEIRVWESFLLKGQPNPSVIPTPRQGNTHTFIVPAFAGFGPPYPQPPPVEAECYSFKVCGDCASITVAALAPDHIELEMAVYAVPAK